MRRISMGREGKVKSFKVVLLSILVITLFVAFLLVVTTTKPVKAVGESITENFYPTDDGEVMEGRPDYQYELVIGPTGPESYHFWVGYNKDNTDASSLKTRVFLKWDLSGIAGVTIDNAYLKLYNKYGPSTGEPPYGGNVCYFTMEACKVSDDSWEEETVTWNNSPGGEPGGGALGDNLASVYLNTAFGDPDAYPSGCWPNWWSLDVTSWVQEQVVGDKIVSIALKAQVEDAPDEDNVCWFYAKNAYETQPRVHLEISYSGPGVSVSAEPEYLEAYPGGTLVYKALVKNIGTVTDTYTLGVSDTRGWTKSLSKYTVGPFDHGENEEVTLSVTIPSSATLGTEDTITVTATSTENTAIHATATCTGHAAEQLTPTDDTFAYAAQPNSTQGTKGYMFAGSLDGAAERSFIKFDLNGIPPGTAVGGGKLWVYCYKISTSPTTVQCWSASDTDSGGVENWRESTLTWNNQPSTGSLLDSKFVENDDRWYYWNVSSAVLSAFGGDKVVSFALKDPNEAVPPDHAAHFDTKDGGAYGKLPHLEIIPNYKVDVNFPDYERYKDNAPGNTLTYTVWINNDGAYIDRYNLSVGDTKDWHPVLNKSTIESIDPDDGESVTLTVTIPSNAVRFTEDTITVTAVSPVTSVTDSDQCIAQAFVGFENLPTDDAYVDDNILKRGTNYGSAALHIGRYFEEWENAYLKFDISEVPEDETIQKAELWMWCYETYPEASTDIYLQACRVDDDVWSEDAITWNTVALEDTPHVEWNDPGLVLDTVHVTVNDIWYKWDVTDFVEDQLENDPDKRVSLLVRPSAACPADKNASFESTESFYEWPFLKIFYSPPAGVNVGITPSTQDNIPGGALSYTVTVTNTGGASDTYDLENSENVTPNWSTLSPTSLTIPAGGNGTATLSVTIPSGTAACTRDNIIVTATSRANPAVKDNDSCIAHAVALIRSVDVSMPTYKSDLPGSTLTYTVTVKNTGNVPDSYTLTRGDNAGWTTGLSKSSVGPLSPNASESATLSVIVPGDAVVNTRDNIWVKATSTENTAVSDTASCIAQVILERIPGVEVSISPSSQDNLQGGTLTYTVTVTSTGNITEDYNLSKTDTRAWALTLVSSVADVEPGENRQVTLTVGIPAAAETNTSDNITVTATSSENTAVKDNASCTARCVTSGLGTSLTISPSSFPLYPGYSGIVQSLTATLRDSNYSPLANKTITWSVASGSVNPSSGTTDAVGQVSVVYTTPTVTAETPQITITASFAGDTQYQASSGTSSGIPAIPVSVNIPASTGGTVVINFIQTNVTVNLLVVPPNALSENTTITVVQAPPESPSGYAIMGCIFDIGPSGTTFTTPATLTLPYDENELPAGMSEDDLAIYHYNTSTNSWERLGGIVDKTANTISIQIDHLSKYSVMVSTSPPPSPPLPWLTIGIVIAVVLIIAVIALLIRQRGGGGEDIFNP